MNKMIDYGSIYEAILADNRQMKTEIVRLEAEVTRLRSLEDRIEEPKHDDLPEYATEEEFDAFLVESGVIDKLLSQLPSGPGVNDFSELESQWPSLENEPDGEDILEAKYGKPTGMEPSQ